MAASAVPPASSHSSFSFLSPNSLASTLALDANTLATSTVSHGDSMDLHDSLLDSVASAFDTTDVAPASASASQPVAITQSELVDLFDSNFRGEDLISPRPPADFVSTSASADLLSVPPDPRENIADIPSSTAFESSAHPPTSIRRATSRIKSAASVWSWLSQFYQRPRSSGAKSTINATTTSFVDAYLAVKRAHELVPTLEHAKRYCDAVKIHADIMLDKATSKCTAADAIKAAYKFIITRDIFPLTTRKLLELQAVLAPVTISATNPIISRLCQKINEWISDYSREQPGFGMLEKLASTAVMWTATFDSISVPIDGVMPTLMLNWMLLSRVRLPFVVPFAPDALADAIRVSLDEQDPLRVLQFVEIQLAEAVDECKTMCAQAMAGDMAAARAEANNPVAVTCIVCLEEDPDVRMSCCSASVHAKCLSDWLRNAPEPTCMQCRKAIDWS